MVKECPQVKWPGCKKIYTFDPVTVTSPSRHPPLDRNGQQRPAWVLSRRDQTVAMATKSNDRIQAKLGFFRNLGS
jgi:hypothetical protein